MKEAHTELRVGACVFLSLVRWLSSHLRKWLRNTRFHGNFHHPPRQKGVSSAARQAGAQSDNPRRRGHLASHWEPGFSHMSQWPLPSYCSSAQCHQLRRVVTVVALGREERLIGVLALGQGSCCGWMRHVLSMLSHCWGKS